jgi:geranylgeranyl transferase type-2 subunit beta
MSATAYLPRLTARLAEGLARLAGRLDRHARYLRAAQNPDGGFSGREGGSDLYYTGFALRGLAVLDELSPAVAERAASFLKSSLQQQASVVDFFSLLYSCLLVQAASGIDPLADSPADWPDRVASTLENFRTADGGYAKGPGGTSGSTYHSFLVTLCYQLLAREVPRPDALVQFVLSRRRDDGGFVEIAPMRKSGTNPTAAGVGVLQIVEPDWPGRMPEVRDGVIELLLGVASDEGGFRANGRVPLADLLSTFTASWTLTELGAADRLDAAEVAAYAGAAERTQGGFRGGLWDENADVEYTFYGLGVLGLLA